MSVDLRSNTMVTRASLVLMDDCLVQLEHGRVAKDRVRRVHYDRIESILVWSSVPWWRVAVCFIFLVLPGLAVMFLRNPVSTGIGIFLAILGAGLIGMYIYCRSTTIRIIRPGLPLTDITGVFRPGKLRRFVERLLANTRRYSPAPVIETAESLPVPPIEQGSDTSSLT